MFAHRLSTIIHSNTVCVLRDGSIAEQGGHAELLERGGEYASMWRRQLEKRASVADPAAGSDPSPGPGPGPAADLPPGSGSSAPAAKPAEASLI